MYKFKKILVIFQIVLLLNMISFVPKASADPVTATALTGPFSEDGS
jgi:hypothetical protein